jgi:hypothetical protein
LTVISLEGTRPKQSKKFDADALTFGREIAALAARNTPVKSEEFTERAAWGEFKKSLIPLVEGVARSGKCAFCERVRDHSELNVDHRRPKAGVEGWSYPDWKKTNAFATSERRPKGRLLETHPGYWWLAYEWTNYALTCWQCNGHWKVNLFPLEAEEARSSCRADDLDATERPLLLDPSKRFESDDHFAWDNTGLVHPHTLEARATVLVCGLNRLTLVEERRSHYAKFAPIVGRFKDACRRRSRDGFGVGQVVREVKNWTGAGSQFAAMCRWMVWDALGRPANGHWSQLPVLCGA